MTSTLTLQTTITDHPRMKAHAQQRQELLQELAAEQMRHELLIGQRHELSAPGRVGAMVRLGAVSSSAADEKLARLDEEIATKGAVVARLHKALGEADMEGRRIRAQVREELRAGDERIVRDALSRMASALAGLQRLDATLEAVRRRGLTRVPIVGHAMLLAFHEKWRNEAHGYGVRSEERGVRLDDEGE